MIFIVLQYRGGRETKPNYRKGVKYEISSKQVFGNYNKSKHRTINPRLLLRLQNTERSRSESGSVE